MQFLLLVPRSQTLLITRTNVTRFEEAFAAAGEQGMKDELCRLGIEKDWHAFREEAFERIARDFPDDHKISWE